MFLTIFKSLFCEVGKIVLLSNISYKNPEGQEYLVSGRSDSSWAKDLESGV